MKKIIILIALVFTTLGYPQAEFEKIAITENTASSSTNKINTQESNGEINYIDAVNLPTPTATTNSLDLKTTLSAGAFSGFAVTNNGDGTISVGSGIAYLRATNDQYAPLIKYPIAAYNNIPLVDNLNNYIVVSYNGGSPALVLNTTGTGIDTQTNSIAIAAARVGTTVHYVSLVGSNSDPNAKLRNRYLQSEGIRRVAGLAISATGRKIATTAGITYSGLIRLDVAAMNTNASDTYTLAYNNGSTWTRVNGQTDVNNTQYNNSGTLTALSNNNFRTDYIYALVNSPSKLFVILGNTQYNTIGAARLAPTPSSLPVELEQLGVLVGRAIIEKDAVTMEMASPFVQDFAAGAIENHNDLAGLQGGTSGEYNHLTNAQVALVAGSEQTANKSATLTASSTLYPNNNAVIAGLATKLDGTATPTATAFTHYFGETASDGIIRPKTLANVRTEIVTTAAVDAAKTNIVTGTGATNRFVKFTAAGTVGNSGFSETSGYINSNLSYIGFADTGGSVFGSTRANAWADNVSTRFFQVGTNLDNAFFTSNQGDSFSRLAFSSLKTQVTDMFFSTSLAPTDVFEVVTGGSKKVIIKSTSGNALFGITVDNGNRGRFAGTVDVNKLQLNNTPATASGTPPLLTWSSTTKDIESVPYATFATDSTVVKLTGNQTVAGVKNFSDGIYSEGLEIGNTSGLEFNSGSYISNLKYTTPTAARSILLPDASGTVALQETVRPYKVYTALIGQTSTNDPTVSVLENTLGGSIVWTRVGVGQYLGTLTGAFTSGKVVAFVSNPSDYYGKNINLRRNGSNNSVYLQTTSSGTNTDGILGALVADSVSIEIRVYN